MYVSSIHRISVISNFSSRVYGVYVTFFFFFKQKTAYEMRISDWSSDVCSSDLKNHFRVRGDEARLPERLFRHLARHARPRADAVRQRPRFREGTRAEGAAGRGNLVPALFGALGRHRPCRPDRKSVVSGKSVSVRVDLGGRRIIKKKPQITKNQRQDTKN